MRLVDLLKKCRIALVVMAVFILFSVKVKGEEDLEKGVVEGVSTAAPFYGNLIVFAEPDTHGEKMGFISNGNEVKILEHLGVLTKVSCAKFPGGGWVWGSYIKPIEDDREIPGGVTLPQLLKVEKPVPNASNIEKMEKVLPKVDKNQIASFIQQIPQTE